MDGRPGFGGTVWAYGCSYAVVRPGWRARVHYLPRASRRLGGGEVRSHAVNGTRIVDVVGAMLFDGTLEGCLPPVAGARWPQDAPRPGPVVIDSLFNDIGHYPEGTVFPVVPAPLEDDRYVEGIAALTRAALAVASSAERVPVSSARLEGAWSPSRVLGEVDSALVTSQPGDRATFRVAPARTGPLVGTAWVLGRAVDPTLGAAAPLRVEVDGRDTGQLLRPHPWEAYVGQAGAPVRGIVHASAVQLPVHGAAHELSLVHAGEPGERAYADAVVVPAAAPGPIAVMGADTPPRPVLWTDEQVAVWEANHARIAPAVRDVVAEFPHARYVASTIPPKGISGRDGIHPNPWGMLRRARDLRRAMRSRAEGVANA